LPHPAPSSPSTSSTSAGTSSNTASPPIGNTFSTVNQAEIDHFSRLSSQWWNEKGEFGLLHKMNPTRMEFVRQKIVQGLQDDEGWSFEKRDRVDEKGNLKRWEGMATVKGKGRWLEGMDVLDVGCGGGLLSEVSLLSSRIRISSSNLFQSLARVGGKVLGIDASSHNIAIASLHASQDPFLPFHSDSPLTSESSQQTVLADKKTGSLRYRHTSAEELLKEGKKYDVVCSMEVLEHVDSPGDFLKCLADMVKVRTAHGTK
jgi:polyprenyldihydroxybenzoate methyltransferase/3-demethylubiquinol 3-O-methyltransferase